MSQIPITASAIIPARADRIYALIADYRNSHARILPKSYFDPPVVEQGGFGEGTVITFQMRLMGQTRTFHSTITEPDPGRVLAETDAAAGTVTTFTVEPVGDGQEASVTINTSAKMPDGIPGAVQGWLTRQLLRPVYKKELAQLAAVAAQDLSK
jgi:hypothetical protein